MVVLGALASEADAHEVAQHSDDHPSAEPAFLGPGGVLPHGRTAYFIEGDTELPGYPAVFVGLRRGVTGWLDYGLAVGGIDTAFVARLHAKARLLEDDEHRWFVGLRLRVEFKRQLQAFSDFPTLDDFGFTVVPELSVARRFGERAEHALYYAAFYYLDIDVRRNHPLQHYVMLGMLGYEYRFELGIHVLADASVGIEIGNPQTEGIVFPRFRLAVGYDF